MVIRMKSVGAYSIRAALLAASMSASSFAQEPTVLRDPHFRNEDISGTRVMASVRRLPGGIYEYRYDVSSPESNHGEAMFFQIDISCAIDFGPVRFPEPPYPHTGGDYSGKGHLPIQAYASISPDYKPLSPGPAISVNNVLGWPLMLPPGNTIRGLRLLTPAPPTEKQFVLTVDMSSTDIEADGSGWDYRGLEDDDTVPWIEDFEVRGTTTGPACALPDGQPSGSTAVVLVIDEDSVAKGKKPNSFSDADVNESEARLGQRRELAYFSANVGATITLHTGQLGDEGWFAFKTVPETWVGAGPTTDGLRNYVGQPIEPYPHDVGSGLGTGDDPETYLDKIPGVTPLRATALGQLIGKTVCAIVYKGDIGINYGPLNGSLKGATRGTVAFEVGTLTPTTRGSNVLPAVQITILSAGRVCGGQLGLFEDAPEPSSSSQPRDTGP